MLGHNLIFGELCPTTWNWLYSFHVAIFFILPFFYPQHVLSWERVKKLFVRLLWPYMWAFILLTIVYYLFQKYGILQKEAPAYWNGPSVIDFVRTLITGNFWGLSPYCGFYYLWFLPVMFSMSILSDIFYTLKQSRVPLLILGFICFVFFWVFMYSGPFPTSTKYTIMNWIPFAVLQGCGMLFLGLFGRSVLQKGISYWYVIAFLLIAICYFIYGGVDMVRYFIWAINPLIAFGTILYIKKRIANVPWIVKIGEMSLPIYILHQPIGFALCQLCKTIAGGWIALVISYISTLIITILFVYLLKKMNIHNFLFPRMTRAVTLSQARQELLK